MLLSRKIKIGRKYLQSFLIKLSSKNLIIIQGSRGYIMCGYLNLKTANKFKDVAIKITGVSTVKEALATKTHSVSYAAKRMGMYKNQPIRDVLKIIA